MWYVELSKNLDLAILSPLRTRKRRGMPCTRVLARPLTSLITLWIFITKTCAWLASLVRRGLEVHSKEVTTGEVAGVPQLTLPQRGPRGRSAMSRGFPYNAPNSLAVWTESRAPSLLTGAAPWRATGQ